VAQSSVSEVETYLGGESEIMARLEMGYAWRPFRLHGSRGVASKNESWSMSSYQSRLMENKIHRPSTTNTGRERRYKKLANGNIIKEKWQKNKE